LESRLKEKNILGSVVNIRIFKIDIVKLSAFIISQNRWFTLRI